MRPEPASLRRCWCLGREWAGDADEPRDSAAKFARGGRFRGRRTSCGVRISRKPPGRLSGSFPSVGPHSQADCRFEKSAIRDFVASAGCRAEWTADQAEWSGQVVRCFPKRKNAQETGLTESRSNRSERTGASPGDAAMNNTAGAAKLGPARPKAAKQRQSGPVTHPGRPPMTIRWAGISGSMRTLRDGELRTRPESRRGPNANRRLPGFHCQPRCGQTFPCFPPPATEAGPRGRTVRRDMRATASKRKAGRKRTGEA